MLWRKSGSRTIIGGHDLRAFFLNRRGECCRACDDLENVLVGIRSTSSEGQDNHREGGIARSKALGSVSKAFALHFKAWEVDVVSMATATCATVT